MKYKYNISIVMVNEHAVLQRILNIFSRYRVTIDNMSMRATKIEPGSVHLFNLSFDEEEKHINILLKKLERIDELRKVQVNGKSPLEEVNRHQLFRPK